MMRIGFVALTGLRVVNAELLTEALSFPALTNRANDIAALPSLGLLTLAGMTEDAVFIELDDAVNDDLPHDLDAVAITALAATTSEIQQLLARFREIGTITITGGLGASLSPDDFVDHSDIVVIGEGEPVWPHLLGDLENNRSQKVYRATDYGIGFDLARSPMPAWHLLPIGKRRRYSIQTQRGCPWACDFCAASMRLSSFKTKPIDRVIGELQQIRDLTGQQFVEFADDNTFADKAHARELMTAIETTDFTFFAETDLSIAEDPELLKRMRAAGCRQVLIGFESPDFNVLDGVEQNANWKARRVDRALRAVETIQQHGIAVVGCFVLGLDGAGPASFTSLRRFIEQSGLFDVQLTYLTPFPGTPLHKRLTDEGRMLLDSTPDQATLFDIAFQPDSMTVKELQEGYRNLMGTLYGEEAIAERRKQFFSHLRARVLQKRRSDK